MCDHPNREAAMTVVRRDEQGTPTVWCDPCIEPLVTALNDAGLATIASCCGHGRRPSVVSLADGRQLLVLPDMDAYSAVAWLWPGINDEPATAELAARGEADDERPTVKQCGICAEHGHTTDEHVAARGGAR